MKHAIASIAIVAGCARDVAVPYPHATPAAGDVEIVLNAPTRDLSVTVNGALVVDRAHSRRARVTGVPAGLARVAIATGGRCEAGQVVERDVEVVPAQVTTIALPAPEPNTGCMIYQGLVYVGMNVAIAGLTIAAVLAPRPK